MSKRAFLALEDGSAYEGYSFGVEETNYGEVVFNTSMFGYQEVLRFLLHICLGTAISMANRRACCRP